MNSTRFVTFFVEVVFGFLGLRSLLLCWDWRPSADAEDSHGCTTIVGRSKRGTGRRFPGWIGILMQAFLKAEFRWIDIFMCMCFCACFDQR